MATVDESDRYAGPDNSWRRQIHGIACSCPSVLGLLVLLFALLYAVFSFSKAEQSARRVAFGCQEERKMFPDHAAPTRFGIESGLRGAPNLAPGCYSPDTRTTFLQPLTEKPQSNRGVYFGASTAPRLVKANKSSTPSPVKYQKVEQLAQVDAYKPFGSAQPRFVAGAEAKPTPGPGKYEHDVPVRHNIQYHESFGSQRAFSSTIPTKCHRGEPDKCNVCKQTPVGDYYEYRSDVLCRQCFEDQLKTGHKYSTSYLMAFKKVRDCTAIHRHDGTAATILLQSEKEQKKLKQREAYLNLYFA